MTKQSRGMRWSVGSIGDLLSSALAEWELRSGVRGKSDSNHSNHARMAACTNARAHAIRGSSKSQLAPQTVGQVQF